MTLGARRLGNHRPKCQPRVLYKSILLQVHGANPGYSSEEQNPGSMRQSGQGVRKMELCLLAGAVLGWGSPSGHMANNLCKSGTGKPLISARCSYGSIPDVQIMLRKAHPVCSHRMAGSPSAGLAETGIPGSLVMHGRH